MFKQESSHLGGILDFSQTEGRAGKELGGKKKKEATKTNPKELKPGKCKGGKVLPRKAKHFFSRDKADCFLFPLHSFLWSNF